MSSSYIVEPQESDTKKDDTLIIVVNDDGTIAVDQETLQNLIMNQSNANVSVVRVGQTEGDAENGDLTFTVDPPAFVPPDSSPTNAASGATDTGLVDPFMEMDPEQLEKLETALQSEQAKQILGENVAAMLDMLTVEEEQNSIRYAIELDHCYTSRTSPSDPEPLDPLPVAHSPDIDQNDLTNAAVLNQSQLSSPILGEVTRAVSTPTKTVMKVKQPVGRPRKATITSVQSLSSVQKSPVGTTAKNSNTLQSDIRKSITKEEENNVDEPSSSSESSESSESDNDSDFGPRGPRRPGVRARGGRRGLTTRGGSMTASRRRGPSKRMDVDQVRRLDIEMAAAVNAMKGSDQLEKVSPGPGRKQLKTIPSRKKEEVSPIKPTPIPVSSPVVEKPLQTTNQVKANLISANMIKGDMILTKPGQGRSTQKVFFVQKKVVMKPNEIKSLGAKQNSIIFTKEPVKPTNQIQTKLGTSDDGKLISLSAKPVAQTPPPNIPSETPAIAVTESLDAVTTPVTTPVQSPPPPLPPLTPVTPKQAPKVTTPISLTKIKPLPETKKEKKKSESTDACPKVEEPPKPLLEIKTPDMSKKHVKKDQRKSPGHVVDALGPALFSTPDIIRRVGSGPESKSSDLNVTSGSLTSDTSMPEVTTPSPSLAPTTPIPSLKTDYSSLGPDMQPDTANLLAESESPMEDYGDEQTPTPLDNEEGKTEPKLSVMDDLPTPLDPASNTTSTEEVARSSEEPVVPNSISDQSGIEGEEHLLATLEMEASKHEEELLAEALLLQEQLDVDLSDPTALDGSTSAIAEPLLSPSTFDTSMLPITSAELSALKSPEPQISTSSPLSSPNSDQIKKKDMKEPIQIVRGGRVITLPPIEAPATRSKRLQVKPETVQKIFESPKKDEKVHKPVITPQLKQMDEMESEIDDEDDEEDNSDSEDDPNRLWCICKRPHNNRFMICCDVCEDWFHGKCVHVSKAMGQQMEEQGIEWVCPNCAKKKVDGSGTKVNKSPTVRSTKVSESPSQRFINEPPASQSPDKSVKSMPEIKPSVGQSTGPVVTQCVVCKKEARNSSIYCSDACILMHAQETWPKEKPPAQSKIIKTSGDVAKSTPDARVIVFERRTGKVLTGTDAPTASNLKNWLKEHPTFEVVRSSSLNTVQIGGKLVTAIQTQGPGKIGKSPQQSNTGQAKMVFAKVMGSKQTILAPSNKKMTVISNLQNTNILSKPAGQVKHTVLISSTKSPILKQMTIKTVPQQNKSPSATKQTPSKKQEPKASPTVTKLPQKSPSVKKSEPEPIRLNIRKTLAELLTTRIKETTDLKLTDEEISDLAINIELELYRYFRDTGAKYKAKYRSLVFNIKDTKNLTLFRKIADRSLTPDAVVRLSPDEMASQELAEWREKETKHQLEMIKKNELDLMAQAKSIVVKTHKGEQIIENDGGIEAVDPKTPVQDIVTVLNSADNTSSDVLEEKEETTLSSLEDAKKTKRSDEKKKKERERERDKDGHRSRKKERSNKDSKRDKSTSRSRSHRSRDRSRDRRRSKDEKRDKEKDRDRERDRDKDKDRDKTKDKDKQKEKDRSRRSSRSSSTRSKSAHKDSKDKEKKRSEIEDETKREDDKKKEPSPIPAEKPIEDRLWRHIEDETTTNTLDGNDSDVSDREPSSTVNIKTPDINEEPEKEKEVALEPEPVNQIKEQKGQTPTVWRGFVNMVDVAKFFITAQEISGHSKDLMEDLPDTVDVVGRIGHETVWDYISKMKKTGSKEILVIRLTAANDEEKIPYITLYSYLNSRSRLGVVGNVSKNIKDFYIMPFSSQSQIPQVLLPMGGPGFEDNRPHLLLGIIVRNKRKRLPHPLPVMATIPSKQPRKDPERSYTPPLVHAAKEKVINPTDKSPQQEIIGENTAVTQLTLNTLNKAHVGMSRGHIDSATISKIVPELSSKIDLTSSPDKAPLARDDDDEPYSPGDIEEDAEDNLAKLTAASNLLTPGKNSTELQRKIDELNRQIEEQKQQIQTISSSFLGEVVPILPGLGHDPPDSNDDADEAYSPTDARSFTPPPPGITTFTQPILDKVSDITIPSNLQEILANVKRQECSKVDSYLPSKPSASFLTSINAPVYQKSDKPSYIASPTPAKETKSTLRSLSDLDLIRKAEEELAAVAAASMAVAVPSCPTPELPPRPPVDPIETAHQLPPPIVESPDIKYPMNIIDPTPKSRASDQPKPPGLEDEDYPTFPSTPPPNLNIGSRSPRSSQKFVPKSGVVLSVKRKMNDDSGSETPLTPTKTARTKSRWGQGPSD